MFNLDILTLVCEKNGISYITFSKDFKIIDFSKNILMIVDDKKALYKENSIQEALWEFVGIEKNILMLLNGDEEKFHVPMICKNNLYYDIEIELFKNGNNEDSFIAYIVKKSNSSLRYLKTIQDINKKTLFLQSNDTKEIKKNYYDLLNKQLISFQVDTQGLITEVNQVCCDFLGKETKELVDRHFSNFFHSRNSTLKNSEEKIFNALNASGEEIFFHADIIPVKRDGIIYENIIICQDVTYLKRIEHELEYAASHDSLTGLANRTQLLKKIDEAIKDSKKENLIFGLCFIDLDKFKPINDTYGHHAGDMLLKHISSLLIHFVRDFDTVARIGGDEFVILFKHIESIEYLNTAVQRINELPKNNPLVYSEDDTIDFGFSLGLSIYPRDADDAASLLDFADKAMYKIKKEHHKNI